MSCSVGTRLEGVGAYVLIPVFGVLAAAGVGAAGVTGSALFDFALNPRSERSVMARLRAGEAEGLDSEAAASDPRRFEARRWFEESKQGVQIEASDGGSLRGWLLPVEGIRASDDGRALESLDGATGEPRGRVFGILCHGYSGRPSDLCIEAQIAHSFGITVLAPAARGHERNDDRYVTMGWRDANDLLGWIDLIRAFDPAARIALYGVSMGGAEVMMASGLALPPNVRCIVEDCGYTSVWDEFSVQIGMQLKLPAVPLLNAASAVCRARAGYGFKEASAERRLRRAAVPMLFIHGSEDRFVPFWMLDRLYDACASPVKEKLIIEGAGHGLSSTVDPDRYWGAVGSFLQRYLF